MHKFHDGGRVRSHDIGHAVGDCKPHHGVVTGRIVLYVIDFRRCDESFAYESRQLPGSHSGYGSEDSAVLGIAFHNLCNGNHKASGEEFRTEPAEIVQPDMGHGLIDIFHVCRRNGNPFGLGGCAGRGGIHQRFAGDEDISFSFLVTLDIGPEGLKLSWLYAFFIQTEQLFRLAGLAD